MCVAAAVAGGALVGGVASSAIGAKGAKDAAQTQADAANNAAAMQQQEQEQVRSDLQPYRDLGTNTIPQLQTALANPLLSAAFKAPTAEDVQATPGYAFTLANGMKAVQNAASARGLGSSGAALKGASAYASGLADSTYQGAYDRALKTYATNYGTASDNVNRLLGLVQVGGNAAAQTGQLGTASTNSIAGTLTSGAAASAAGQVGAANAATSGIASAVNGGTNALLINSLTKQQPATMYGGFNPTYQSSYSGFDNPSNYG